MATPCVSFFTPTPPSPQTCGTFPFLSASSAPSSLPHSQVPLTSRATPSLWCFNSRHGCPHGLCSSSTTVSVLGNALDTTFMALLSPNSIYTQPSPGNNRLLYPTLPHLSGLGMYIPQFCPDQQCRSQHLWCFPLLDWDGVGWPLAHSWGCWKDTSRHCTDIWDQWTDF